MARVVDSAAVLKHFSLGPVLSPRVDAAYATEPLKRSSWQHGLVVAAQAFEDPRSGYGALQVFLGAGVGVVAGVALTGLPLYLQFVIGGVAGLATYWAVPTAWGGCRLAARSESPARPGPRICPRPGNACPRVRGVGETP
jgi:hypothetical protein